MKIEPGKYYKTRDGRKVLISATDAPNESYPIHGRDEKGYVYTWSTRGNFLSAGGNGKDIIAPWEEPKPKLKAYISTGGVVKFSAEALDDTWTRAPWLDEPEEGE